MREVRDAYLFLKNAMLGLVMPTLLIRVAFCRFGMPIFFFRIGTPNIFYAVTILQESVKSLFIIVHCLVLALIKTISLILI